MSYTAIAAVLARDDLAAGERLVAFSLASFANSEHRAWPGEAAAAARAGLGKSRYLEARDQLVRRGVIEVEHKGAGRGRASTVRLVFAQSGPWWDGAINAPLVEAVLGYRRTRGSARLLLAAMAALADERGVIDELSTEELCRAAGLANSTYRRARAALLAAGEVSLQSDGGGRGLLNRWRVSDPRELDAELPAPLGRRSAPPVGARPLIAAVATGRTEEDLSDAQGAPEKGPAMSGVLRDKRPGLSGVAARKRPGLSEVPGRKGPVLTGVSVKTQPETPPQTPPPHVRAGREPQNQRTNPPSPPEGGSDTGRQVVIEQDYRTPAGRRRRGLVSVNVDSVRAGLVAPGLRDVVDWERIRQLLTDTVGQSTFEIWIRPCELVAVDADLRLVVAAPASARSWIRDRFKRVIADCANSVARTVLIADDAVIAALEVAPLAPADLPTSGTEPATGSVHRRSGASACSAYDSSADASYSTSACALSYTPAYNQEKEVG